MAVEKVGGTYVIKASPVKAGTTSTGQSWANLVTQQKYQLWQIANAEAARRIKFEQMNAQRQQQVVDQMRRDLMRQQEDTRNQIANLKQLQVEDVAKQQADMARETNLRGRPERRTTSSGAGGGYSGQRYNLIQEGKRLQDFYSGATDQFNQLVEAVVKAGADETVLTDWAQGKNISENESKIIGQLDDAGKSLFNALKTQQKTLKVAGEEYDKFAGSDVGGRHTFVQERLSGGTGGGFGGGRSRTYYTKGEPIVGAPVVDRGPAIKELEDRLKQLEKQQLELKDVDIPVGDEIRTTRQILGSKFGEGTQRLPEQPMAQPAPAPAPVREQLQVQEQEQVQEQAQKQAQDLSNVRPVDSEILELVAEPEDMEPAIEAQTDEDSRLKPKEVAVTDISPELIQMALGKEETEEVDRFAESIDEERLQALDQQDINRNVLQEMRQAELESLQRMVEESIPKLTPFREVKAVMDEASKTFNNAELQIAGLQMLQDYAYLQQTNPDEYYKLKEVVLSAVAKRMSKKDYQIQQAAKVLINANQVTPQGLAGTVKGSTVKDAELVMQLTGSLFDDVNSIESSYENARQQINRFADRGGLTEDERTQMLTLLEVYKAYKSSVIER